MDNKEFALQEHEKWAGKIEVISRAKLDTPEDLAVCYTPGVAEPCIIAVYHINFRIHCREKQYKDFALKIGRAHV